ncbi:hypothetical protein WMF45_50905 [Sorangium sp. So ce448]|uniref:hypothetical protein n=1 Tax=Sorangium sp. So ce448 TaxID=3133314 RepID=UPI003F63A829
MTFFHPRSEFEEYNVFLHLVLGLVSAAGRFDALLSRYGRTRRGLGHRPVGVDGPGGQRGGEDEQVVFLVLGVASLRARFGRYVEGMRSPGGRAAFRRPLEAAWPRDLGNLLR